MKFKSWLNIDEARFKGLQRQFFTANPEMPKYVANQIYNSQMGPSFRRTIAMGGNSPTIAFQPEKMSHESPTIAFQPQRKVSIGLRQSPSQLSPDLQGVVWSKTPIVIEVTPLDFDRNTLDLFLEWRFGYAPKNSDVTRDEKRFDFQRRLLQQRELGENEPIVLVKEAGKYRLIDGFHRTMVTLLHPFNDALGAPPDQKELLKNGRDLHSLDFSKWVPVPLKAFVGTKTTHV